MAFFHLVHAKRINGKPAGDRTYSQPGAGEPDDGGVDHRRSGITSWRSPGAVAGVAG
jgi:hypothetical protein